MARSRPRYRLRTGIRVSQRDPGSLQVGLHEDQCLVLADDTATRHVLDLLSHGLDPGLLAAVDEHTARTRVRAAARVRLAAPDPERGALSRLLAANGLVEAAPRGRETVRLLVSIGAEPRRERLDDSMRSDRPHLLLTEVAGRIRLGPCVVPGLTSCVRCVDEHLTDRDPRHPLVLEQHVEPSPADRAPEAERQLALAWAVRDLVALIDGDRPWTWSATVEIREDGPIRRAWQRHPRCGCAWGDQLAG
jgi:hypothetical protein